MKYNIEHAASVAFGEWVPIEKIDIPIKDTPESLLISKEVLKTMSEDCQILASLILNAPAELFFDNGELKVIEFRRYCRHKKNWSAPKVDALKEEIGAVLKALSF